MSYNPGMLTDNVNRLITVESVQTIAPKYFPCTHQISFIASEERLDPRLEALKIDRMLRGLLHKKTYDYLVRYHARILAEEMRQRNKELQMMEEDVEDAA